MATAMVEVEVLFFHASYQLMEHIANTEKLIIKYEAKIVGKLAARDTIKSGTDTITQKKKKRKD